MEELLAIAHAQLGLFTAAQWTGAGLNRRSLTYKKRAGEVDEVHPGVFRFAAAPASFEQRVLAGCLSVDGVASHRWPEETAELIVKTIERRRRAA